MLGLSCSQRAADGLQALRLRTSGDRLAQIYWVHTGYVFHSFASSSGICFQLKNQREATKSYSFFNDRSTTIVWKQHKYIASKWELYIDQNLERPRGALLDAFSRCFTAFNETLPAQDWSTFWTHPDGSPSFGVVHVFKGSICYSQICLGSLQKSWRAQISLKAWEIK